MSEQSVSLASELISDFLSYSTAIYNRALPDIVDGLKVAQRRAIVGMNDLHLSSSGQYCKVSRLEGHVLGRYHPQGGCAGTIINMGQHSAMRYVLTDIHGNAGGSIQSGPAVGQLISEDSPAAARYLEVRATRLCEELYLSQLHKGLGSWRSNYDDTTQEPVRFVPLLPAILLTGAQGIASGYACNFIPYNLSDVIKATTALVKNRNISDNQLVSKISNPPEPPQGGRVVKDDSLKEVILSGKGSVTVYGEWEITDKLKWGKRSTRSAIIVTKLATGSSEKFLEKVRDLADSEKLPGLVDAADHSSRDGIRIVLVVKTPEERDGILKTLIHSNTGLKHQYNVNSVAVDLEGKPKTVGVRDVVLSWYESRVNYLVQIHKKEVEKLTEERNKFLAILSVLADIDKFLKVVRSAKDKPSAVAQVAKQWKMEDHMAKYVIEIPISTLIKTEQSVVKDKDKELELKINNLVKLCSPGPDLDQFICSQIASMRPLCASTRAVWMEESIQKPETHKVPTERDKMADQAKKYGVGPRAVNKWIKENTGKGKLSVKWEHYLHECKMSSRVGRKEYNDELLALKADAESRGLPKRGKLAWNAFISTCQNERVEEVRARMESWLINANANPRPNQPQSRATPESRRRGSTATRSKQPTRAKGKK